MSGGYACIIVSLTALALASFVIYDEERLKSARFTLGIVTLAAVLTPLIFAIKGIENIDFSYTDTDYSTEIVTQTLKEAFENGIAEAVESKFSVESGDVLVVAEGFDEEKMRAERIILTLSGRAVLKNVGAIESYVTELGLGKCTAEVKIG